MAGVALSLKERVGTLEAQVNGRGGKGVHRRLDDIEGKAEAFVTREELAAAIAEIKELIRNRQSTARWIVEQVIKFAPWLVIIYTLARDLAGK